MMVLVSTHLVQVVSFQLLVTNPDATLSDGSCIYPDADGNCDEEELCDSDVDGDGICDEDEVGGCIYMTASNYNPDATDDDGSCMFNGCTNDDFSNYNLYANTNEDVLTHQ